MPAPRRRKAAQLLAAVAFATLVHGQDDDAQQLDMGMPVVINMGPLMELAAGFDEALDNAQQSRGKVAGPPVQIVSLGDSLDQFHPPHQDLLQGLMENFGSHLGPAIQAGDGGFQTEVKNGHFWLRGSLPGYRMHTSGDGGDEKQPLNVQVLGRSLVVRGSQTRGPMVSSFQRSFPLPWEPEPDTVSVTYSAKDGSLVVDVPAKAGQTQTAGKALSTAGDGAELFGMDDPFEMLSAPQMTVTFSGGGPGGPFGGAMPMPPALRGRRGRMNGGVPLLASILNDFMDVGTGLAADPFEELWKGLDEESERNGVNFDDEGGIHIIEHRGSLSDSAEARSTTTPRKAPVVVQPKNAQTFWRLASSDRPSIDIVAPQGVDVGKPEGNHVQIYAKSQDDGSGPSKPVQNLALPVNVKDEDCSRTETSSQERVLRCRIQDDSVRNVRINVIDEL